MGDTIIRIILLKLQLNCTINGKRRKYFLYWSAAFCIRSKVPCNRDTSYHLWIAMSLRKNLNQLDLINLLNPYWPSSAAHSLFFGKKFTFARFHFLLRRLHDSIFSLQISTQICCKTLHTIFQVNYVQLSQVCLLSLHTTFGTTARFSIIDVQEKWLVSLGHRSLFYQLQHLIQTSWN